MSRNFEDKIKPILLYVGTIGAVAMGIAYIILMFVLVLGFDARAELTQTIVFAIINAIVGFIIMQFLKIQGISFAKDLPENKTTLDKYATARPKKNKTHSLKWFWIKTILTDLVVKALSVAIATAGIIYIVIQGSNDYNMLLLSLVNLIMFACFGLLSLVKAYDFFNDCYIPYLIEIIYEKQKADKEPDKNIMALAKEQPNQQENDTLCINRRVDILDTSVDTSAFSNNG